MTFGLAAPMIRGMVLTKWLSLRRLSSRFSLYGGTALGIILSLFAFLHVCAKTGGLQDPPVAASSVMLVPPASRGHEAEHPRAGATSHHEARPTAPASEHDERGGKCDGPSRSGCPHSTLCCLTWPPAVGRYVLPSPHTLASFDQVFRAVPAWSVPHLRAETSQFALIPSDAPPPLATVAGPVANRAPPSLV